MPATSSSAKPLRGGAGRVAGVVVLVLLQSSLVALLAFGWPPRIGGGLSEETTCVGYVGRFGDNVFEVVTYTERRQVRVDVGTQWVLRQAAATPSVLRPGALVVMRGTADAAGVVRARIVTVLN
jgi:hypothetical protein